MPSLVEIAQVVLEKKMKMWKVYDNSNKDDNNGQRTNLTWAFASGELKRTYEEAQTPLLQIRVSYYLGGVEVKYFVFDAVGATKTDWFSRSRLLETNYDITALTTAVGKSGEYFSIAG